MVEEIRIRLEISILPEGYVVANVMAAPMKDNGDFNGNVDANPINPTTTSDEAGETLRSYSVCTMTVPDGQNYYIRVFLAKTAGVTVRLRSRGSSVDATFSDNTVANSYMIFNQENAKYGANFYPVIISNGGNKYNTDDYYVDTDPATRTVEVVEQTKLSGTLTMPRRIEVMEYV